MKSGMRSIGLSAYATTQAATTLAYHGTRGWRTANESAMTSPFSRRARALHAFRPRTAARPSHARTQDLGDGLGREAELQTRQPDVEAFTVGGDASTLEIEEAHAAKAHTLACATGQRLRGHIGKRPLGRSALRRFHHGVHHPRIFTALPEHALEHRAQRGLARVGAEEVVGVRGARGEAREEGVHIRPVEGLFKLVNDRHGRLFRRRPAGYAPAAITIPRAWRRRYAERSRSSFVL